MSIYLSKGSHDPPIPSPQILCGTLRPLPTQAETGKLSSGQNLVLSEG